MTMDNSDHVQWLRQQAKAFAKAATTEPDTKRRQMQQDMATRLKAAGDALQMALAGIDLNAAGGNVGIAKRLGRGRRVIVRLRNGNKLTGLMGSLSRYDFVLTTDDGQELVVAKHAVAYWIVTPDDAPATTADVPGESAP